MKPNRQTIRALENIFAAEIEGKIFQSGDKIYRDLLAAGLIDCMQKTVGSMEIYVYELTHAGRILYCENCE